MTRRLLAASALILSSSPAFAASQETSTVTVDISDLDVRSSTGRTRMQARVGRAADRVCGVNDARGVNAHRAFRLCRTAAMRDALGQ